MVPSVAFATDETASALQQRLTDKEAGGGTVTMNSNVEIKSGESVNVPNDVTLETNGHTLTVADGGKLTVSTTAGEKEAGVVEVDGPVYWFNNTVPSGLFTPDTNGTGVIYSNAKFSSNPFNLDSFVMLDAGVNGFANGTRYAYPAVVNEKVTVIPDPVIMSGFQGFYNGGTGLTTSTTVTYGTTYTARWSSPAPAPTTYTVTSGVKTLDTDGRTDISATETGGTISPVGTQTVSEGGSASFTFTANSGYKFSHLEVNSLIIQGAYAQTMTEYTLFSITGNQTIMPVYEKPLCRTITASGGDGG